MWFADDGAKSRSRGPSRGQDGGFTLVEMLMVIVILGILAAVVVFAVGGIRGNATSAACAHDKRVVETALEAHAVHNGSYPSTLAGLQTNPASLKSAQIAGNRLTGEDYFLDYDPANHGLTCSVAPPSAGGGGGGGGGVGGGGADTIAPTSAAAITAGTPGLNGWRTSNVTVSLTATDAGTPTSGVASITYRLSGATSLGSTTISGSSASQAISAEGVTTVHYGATDSANNAETEKSVDVKIDKTAPVATISQSGAVTQPVLSGFAGHSTAASGDDSTVTVTVYRSGVSAPVWTFTAPVDPATGEWGPKTYGPGNLPSNKTFTAHVQQTDAAGNTSPDSSVTWSS